MRTVFADTFYWLSLVNERDAAHAAAVAFNDGFRGTLVTTGWVLCEFGDAMAQPGHREAFLAAVDQLQADPDVRVVGDSDALLHAGIDLFRRRPDKEWSLTDCISFIVMQREGVTEALTGDRHFEQAGFRTAFK